MVGTSAPLCRPNETEKCPNQRGGQRCRQCLRSSVSRKSGGPLAPVTAHGPWARRTTPQPVNRRSKTERTKAFQRTPSNHSGVKPDFNSTNATRKPPNRRKLSNTVLNNLGVKKIQGMKHVKLRDDENSADQPGRGLSGSECGPPHQRVAALIPGQGASLGCRFGPQMVRVREAAKWRFSPTSVFLSLPSPSLPSP